MEAKVRKNLGIDLPPYMWIRLEERARECRQTLPEYVSVALMDFELNEPNEETRTAIMEAKNRKEYPADELYDDVDEMFKAILSEK